MMEGQGQGQGQGMGQGMDQDMGQGQGLGLGQGMGQQQQQGEGGFLNSLEQKFVGGGNNSNQGQMGDGMGGQQQQGGFMDNMKNEGERAMIQQQIDGVVGKQTGMLGKAEAYGVDFVEDRVLGPNQGGNSNQVYGSLYYRLRHPH
eukprot:SM000092S24509  [mRNA]  locus=s92:354078:354959:- [translate_table: standard]